MNYSRYAIQKKKHRLTSDSEKSRYRMKRLMRYLREILIVAFLAFIVVGVYGRLQEVTGTTKKLQKRDILASGTKGVLYDIENKKIGEIGDEDLTQEYVSMDSIPICVRQAFVASQDSRFYEHHGIDIQEIFEKIYHGALEDQTIVSVSSTITQQLVCNQLHTSAEKKNVSRKIEEIIKEQYLAFSLEDDLSKTEILELYLNTVNLGRKLIGVQSASKRYFGKPISEVTMSEATVLAAIVDDPERYDPIKAPEENSKARTGVLKSMLSMGYISEDEYEDAIGDDVYIRMQNRSPYLKENAGKVNSYYIDATLQQVISDLREKLGYSATQAYQTVYKSGIQIFTCQDTKLQQICEDVAWKKENYTDINTKKQPEISLVLMDQATGKVNAIIGGSGERTQKFSIDHATELKSQPGSLLDILSTYTPAIDTAGFTLGSVEDDAPYLFPNTLTAVKKWKETNYKGFITLREAISLPASVPAVKTLEKVSVQTGYEYLKRYGLTTLVEDVTVGETPENLSAVENDVQLTLAQGKLTDGVTNLEMTAAYATLANGGSYQSPRFYSKVIDANGRVLLDNNSEHKRIMKESTAWLLTSALSSQKLTGADEEKVIASAGRQSITLDKLNDWYEGYTPYYTMGIWVGFDKNHTKLTSGAIAGDMWKEIMERILQEKKISTGVFKKPADIISESICKKCGKLAVKGLCNLAEGGNQIGKEYFVKGTEPTENCDCHVRFVFCKESNILAGENCPKKDTYNRILLNKEEQSETEDTNTTITQNLSGKVCEIHGTK